METKPICTAGRARAAGLLCKTKPISAWKAVRPTCIGKLWNMLGAQKKGLRWYAAAPGFLRFGVVRWFGLLDSPLRYVSPLPCRGMAMVPVRATLLMP